MIAMRKILYWPKLAGIAVIIGGGLLFLGGAGAEIYKYVDSKGVTHFTDRFESVPPEYRHQIKVIKEQPPSQVSTPAAEPAPEKTTEADRPAPPKLEIPPAKGDNVPTGPEEEKLKARQEKEKQIAELKQQIEEKRKQQRSLRTNWMVYDRYAIVRLNQEIEALEKKIKVLQQEMEEEK